MPEFLDLAALVSFVEMQHLGARKDGQGLVMVFSRPPSHQLLIELSNLALLAAKELEGDTSSPESYREHLGYVRGMASMAHYLIEVQEWLRARDTESGVNLYGQKEWSSQVVGRSELVSILQKAGVKA